MKFDFCHLLILIVKKATKNVILFIIPTIHNLQRFSEIFKENYSNDVISDVNYDVISDSPKPVSKTITQINLRI